jgi:hypothetical protein
MQKILCFVSAGLIGVGVSAANAQIEDSHAHTPVQAPAVRAATKLNGADLMVPGNEFSVASGFTGPIIPDPWPAQGGGTHFHSADGTPGVAATENDLEVGDFSSNSEEVRGMVEFDLAGLDSDIAEVRAQCDVAILGGLYGQGSSVFDVALSYYTGDNVEGLTDFGSPFSGLPVPNQIGTFSTDGLLVGDNVGGDVTGPYLAAIANGDPALGVLAQAGSDPGVGAITFNNCYLLITEENIDIDIKPGSFPNSINTKSKGVIPVAILGSAEFDVTLVDTSTLEFGPAGASPAHRAGGHVEDVNRDGLMDLVSHYRTRETGLAPGDTEACVVGETNDGTRIRGCDSVKIVK